MDFCYDVRLANCKSSKIGFLGLRTGPGVKGGSVLQTLIHRRTCGSYYLCRCTPLFTCVTCVTCVAGQSIADCSVCSCPIFPTCWDTVKCEAMFVLWVSLCRPPTYLRMREMNQLRFVPWTSRERRADWVDKHFVRGRDVENARNPGGISEVFHRGRLKHWSTEVAYVPFVWSTEAHDSTQATLRVKETKGVQNSAILAFMPHGNCTREKRKDYKTSFAFICIYALKCLSSFPGPAEWTFAEVSWQ